MEYVEYDEQLGAEIHWKNTEVVFSKTTHRRTVLEFVKRPTFGLSCFMNGSIQSCLSDEMVYHKALTDTIKHIGCVAIFGGGEGATARELLTKKSGTAFQRIDMFEWDADVIDVFRTQFPQWAQGAWNDSRLNIYNYDIFEHISKIPDCEYNSVVIDLFEPHDQSEDTWKMLFNHMFRIIKEGGSFSMYAGMLPHTNDIYIQHIMCAILRQVGFFNVTLHTGEHIPSYLGRPMFIYGHKIDTQLWILESERE
jgi:spermidine synthase